MARILILIITLLLPSASYAIQESRALPVNTHLHVITYHPNDIHKYVGYYNYEASILLDDGEAVSTVAMGDKDTWEFNDIGNRIFLRPIAQDPSHANTNMLLVTNKRVYHFILEAAEVDPDLGVDDPNLVFETKFLYPGNSGEVQNFSKQKGPDLSEPEKYNFNYTMSGSDEIAPLRVFDDGEFTYFQFKQINAEVPAFFLVDSEGREALINYRVTGEYIVLERVTSQLTLRHGHDVTCIFNENRPLERNGKNGSKRRSFKQE